MHHTPHWLWCPLRARHQWSNRSSDKYGVTCPDSTTIRLLELVRPQQVHNHTGASVLQGVLYPNKERVAPWSALPTLVALP